MEFEFSYDDAKVILRPKSQRAGFLSLFGRSAPVSLNHLDPNERQVAFAIGDLRAIEAEHPGSIVIHDDSVEMTHDGAAKVGAKSGQILGLPPLVDLELHTDAEGIVGSDHFRLHYEWQYQGRTVEPKRTGAFLNTARGVQRVPSWMLGAIRIADCFDPNEDEVDHWTALARFRKALVPEEEIGSNTEMSNFLSGLKVSLADSFSISPIAKGEYLDFAPVPFATDTLLQSEGDEVIEEAASELDERELSVFQDRFQRSGALPAYKTGDKSYLVVDPSAKVTLEVMEEKKRATAFERAEFVKNPKPAITAAIQEDLEKRGALAGLNDAQIQEAIETATGATFVETREYSERVIGIGKWKRPELGDDWSSGTEWMPEGLSQSVVDRILKKNLKQTESVLEEMKAAAARGDVQIDVDGQAVPVNSSTIKSVESRVEQLRKEQEKTDGSGEDEGNRDQTTSAADRDPIVVQTKHNFEKIEWRPDRNKRDALVEKRIPELISTPLKEHQTKSFEWSLEAWSEGLPGILNADEQGLGKTLQTLSFLTWLKTNMAHRDNKARLPILVVAPTSLLENWEEEVSKHIGGDGLGFIYRLYGNSISGFRRKTGTGKDTDKGQDTLNFDALHEAIEDGRGDRVWILTTYTTMTNYQHSLAKIPFSCAVFDEIQNIKNPGTLAAASARAIRADFRIGLTGTPIENVSGDLWSIMDQLVPGALGSLREFNDVFGSPNEENMSQLHQLVFKRQDDGNGAPVPPMAIRRVKEEAAKDLPSKTRMLHPRLMPELQATVYDAARLNLAKGGLGARLAMIHHIRTVSVHPNIEGNETGESFVNSSARLEATFEILDRLASKGERALVFIENIKMQYRFVELIKQRYQLPRVDIINGKTPIKQRQAIVNRFQRHLVDDKGFDLLVLGPKAAGTGLTLTAATHVIHLSRWWNPAVEEQCNDRVHRIGQTKPVEIHVPMAIHPGYREGSFDCLLHSLMQRKRKLASSALWPLADSRGDAALLQSGLTEIEINTGGEPLESAMIAMFERDGASLPQAKPDGSLVFS